MYKSSPETGGQSGQLKPKRTSLYTIALIAGAGILVIGCVAIGAHKLRSKKTIKPPVVQEHVRVPAKSKVEPMTKVDEKPPPAKKLIKDGKELPEGFLHDVIFAKYGADYHYCGPNELKDAVSARECVLETVKWFAWKIRGEHGSVPLPPLDPSLKIIQNAVSVAFPQVGKGNVEKPVWATNCAELYVYTYLRQDTKEHYYILTEDHEGSKYCFSNRKPAKFNYAHEAKDFLGTKSQHQVREIYEGINFLTTQIMALKGDSK